MRTPSARLVWCLCFGALALACGNKSGPSASPGARDASALDSAQGVSPQPDASPETSTAADAGADAFVVGPHSPLPKVPQNGGPVLATPRLVTVSFAAATDAGAPDASEADASVTSDQVAAFGGWIMGSSWLSEVGKDYGVGQGTHVHVTLGPAPSGTISDDQVQALLLSHIADGSLPSSAGDGGSTSYLYELFFPAGTIVTAPVGLGGGGDTCVDFGGSFLGGYHWQTTTPQVAYAVVPTCSSGTDIEGAGDIEAEASHEIIEACTDPFPATALGWAIINPNNAWDFLDGEVADLCSPEQLVESGFTVQRVWSNSAVANGTNPCTPAPSEPFYDATTTPAAVQNVHAGQKITFKVQGFSNAPIAPWSLLAFTSNGTFDPKPSLDRSMIGNGGTATLTLTIPSTVVSEDYALVILNSSTSLTDYSYWPVAVQVP